MGQHVHFVDQLSFSATIKGSPGVPEQNLLVPPMGHLLSRPNICMGLDNVEVSSLVLYAAIKNCLLLDQLQINNSDSCGS